MAINFQTTDAAALLAAFKKAIDSKHVVTWAYDPEGDFYHTPEQWRQSGWLRPAIYTGQLTMNFVGRNTKKTTKADYGVLHGRFIESMLTHCDQLFSNATATASPTNSDIITTVAA
jgi:hypothetical protein